MQKPEVYEEDEDEDEESEEDDEEVPVRSMPANSLAFIMHAVSQAS